MLELLTVLLLAIAVSFDTLAIGMTYGTKDRDSHPSRESS